MSEYSTAYQVACFPGPDAAVVVTRGPNGAPVLMVYLDPVNMTIHGAPAQDDGAAFFRELAGEAARLADMLDAAAAGPHHLLREDGGDAGVV